MPSNSFTVELASAVPAIFGVLLVVVSEELVMTGAAGGVVSTVIVIEDDVAMLPALSVACAVIVCEPDDKVDGVYDQDVVPVAVTYDPLSILI